MTVNNIPQDMKITQTEAISDEHSDVQVNLADEMKSELNTWAGVLIVIGIVNVAFLSALVPGIMLIIGGALNLMIRHRSMFIVNGLALTFVGLVGVSNFFIQGEVTSLLDFLFVGMGIWEMNKFRKYA